MRITPPYFTACMAKITALRRCFSTPERGTKIRCSGLVWQAKWHSLRGHRRGTNFPPMHTAANELQPCFGRLDPGLSWAPEVHSILALKMPIKLWGVTGLGSHSWLLGSGARSNNVIQKMFSRWESMWPWAALEQLHGQASSGHCPHWKGSVEVRITKELSDMLFLSFVRRTTEIPPTWLTWSPGSTHDCLWGTVLRKWLWWNLPLPRAQHCTHPPNSALPA